MKYLDFENDESREIIERGDILAFPTETVFGLGIRWDDENAYEKLCTAKHRRFDKPISLMVGRKFPLDSIAYLDEGTIRVINKLLPGPLTLLLKAKTVPHQADLGTSTIGVRIPDKEDLLTFLDSFGYPLMVTSANISGEKPAYDSDECSKIFSSSPLIKGIVEGKCVSDIPSTVCLIREGNIRIVREGEITLDQIKEAYYGR